MSELHHHLHPVRWRQRFLLSLRLAAWGLLIGAVAAVVCGVLRLFQFPIALPHVVSLTVGCPCLGFCLGLFWQSDWSSAARAVDVHYRLKDRTVTALQFMNRSPDATLQQLQVEDALGHLNTLRPREVVPLRTPRVLPVAVFVLAVSAILLAISDPSPATASIAAPLDVVLAQAKRAELDLERLQEFAEEEKDADLEELLKELQKKIDELKEPGVDIREALAKFSEMQAVLQQQQAEYNTAAVDAQLQAAGEAMMLAEPLASAGKSLMKGEFDKAAEELEKLEAPQLDRQSEKAVRDKLNKVAQSMQNSGQASLGEATQSMSESLGQDDLRFAKGAKKLAGEARRHGKRKKIRDLLLKQSECLGECKSECEGSRVAFGKGKGGNKWGLGVSGNELGDQTPNLGSRQQEKLTGQQSAQGELEVETVHSPEGEQQAQRSYREVYQEYKKISEAVLESEPIPLGHRQTIRRYFESIRPQQTEQP